MRCTACGEAWFVPYPELLDAEPIEELTVEKRARPQRPVEKARPGGKNFPQATQNSPIKSKSAARAAQTAKPARAQKFDDQVEAEAFDYEEEDDSLFGAPPTSPGHEPRSDRSYRDDIDDAIEEEAPEEGRRLRFPFGGRRKNRAEDETDLDEHFIEQPAQDKEPPFLKQRDQAAALNQKGKPQKDAVDAKYEVIGPEDDDFAERQAAPLEAELSVEESAQDRRQGFGRRATDRANHPEADRRGKDDRRAGTEIARLEDVSPFDPEEFDEDFFKTLRATPEDLARALNKTRRRAEVRRKNRLTPLRALGWFVWLSAVIGVCYSVYNFRDEIVKIAPKTADAYAIIGIDADPYGLAIENVQHRLAMSTNGATIEISGQLRNNGDGSIEAPMLQAEALGPRGELLSRWTFSPDGAEVLEGATIDFITRAPAPEGVAEVALSFAPAKSPVSDIFPGLQQ